MRAPVDKSWSFAATSITRVCHVQISQQLINRLAMCDFRASFLICRRKRKQFLTDFFNLLRIAGRVMGYNIWLACSWKPLLPIGSLFWPCSKSVAGPLKNITMKGLVESLFSWQALQQRVWILPYVQILSLIAREYRMDKWWNVNFLKQSMCSSVDMVTPTKGTVYRTGLRTPLTQKIVRALSWACIFAVREMGK